MAKKVRAIVKLQINGGQATPAPPVGPALGQHGVNIMQFVKEYNARTAEQTGAVVPVELTVFEDRSYTFVLKTSPASELLRKATGLDKGAGQPTQIVGSITREQVRQIAEAKMRDLNANDPEAAMKIIEGTARSMGINVAEG